MFAVGWKPLRIFDEENPVPFLPDSSWPGSRWAWRHRLTLLALRKALKPAYDRVARMADGHVDFRQVFEAFADAAFLRGRHYALEELLPECSWADKVFLRKRAYSAAVRHARERIEIFLRYLEHVYAADERPFRNVLEQDGSRLSKLKEADLLVGDEKIVISTIHRAKGRQFDAVAVANAAGVVSGKTAAEAEEGRRLLYVAMSRAKRHLLLFGGDHDGIFKAIEPCFAKGYEGYYLRRGNGVGISGDWLCRWEELADLNLRGVCPPDTVEDAFLSQEGPVVRIALKVMRHCPDRELAVERCLMLIDGRFAGPAIDCLREIGCYDERALRAVRASALSSGSDNVRDAAFAHFRSGLETGSERSFILQAIGDAVYDTRGEMRLRAVQVLEENGIAKWSGVVTGAGTDFKRLATVEDDAHEGAIRSLAASSSSKTYTRMLKELLFERASMG